MQRFGNHSQIDVANPVLSLIKVFVFIEDIDQVLVEDHRPARVSFGKFRYANGMMVF